MDLCNRKLRQAVRCFAENRVPYILAIESISEGIEESERQLDILITLIISIVLCLLLLLLLLLFGHIALILRISSHRLGLLLLLCWGHGNDFRDAQDPIQRLRIFDECAELRFEMRRR